MEIRPLSENDAAIYWNLRGEALETELFAFGSDLQDFLTTGMEAIATRLGNTSNFTLGAFELGQLIRIATFVRETGVKERHKGHIYGVYVTLAQRRKRVGQQLIGALLKRAREDASLEQIVLAVTTCQEAAWGLY
jgi:ribosomal protein S18 acetylase RimI-like enzyme